MEDDQELKLYTCRFCSKSFTCGRSLGGHMRSHMITNSAETEKPNTNTNTRRKLPNPELGLEPACHSSYGLRENPKKTSRFGDSTNESFSLRGKFCKDCGKEFHSWKALFGHMKCHSNKDRIVSDSFEAAAEEEEEEEGEEEQKSWISSSSNETNQPNGGSRRQRASAVGHAAASSSFSSVSQIEQEQEEVAMSLMMLSRDVGHLVGGLHSIADSSDNSSVFLDDPSPGRTSLGWKLEEKTSPAWKQKGLEKSGYGSLRMGGKRIKRPKFDRGCKIGGSDIELEKNLASMKCNSRKRKSADDDSCSPELGVDFESESCKASSHKTSKFECTTCKKVFHSYQALGGHRASHKKTKGCFAWRLEGGENSLGTEASPDPAVEYYSLDQEASNVFSKKKNRGHECQICFKVFSSGQALGGHKRSHLVGGSDVKSSVTIAIQKPASSEIRDLLDLNLPAPVEDESNGDNAIEFRPWWAGSSRATNMNPLPV